MPDGVVQLTHDVGTHLVPLDLRTDALSDDAGDLSWLGVAPQARLGEDELTVEGHLEAAAARRDKLDVLDDRCPAGQQFVRQTDGPRHVVSGNAELDPKSVPGLEHRTETTGVGRTQQFAGLHGT